MRTLYFTISLVLLFVFNQVASADKQVASADTKIDAIDNVTLTPCLTTRVIFNKNALKSYQASKLRLQVENEADGNIYDGQINQKNGLFYWEKAIPVGEKLTFTVFKENKPISYSFSKAMYAQLTNIIIPIRIARNDIEPPLVRGFKKSILIPIEKKLMNKELLVIVTNKYGKPLWQYYGVVGNETLTAEIPNDVSVNDIDQRVIVSNTVCNK